MALPIDHEKFFGILDNEIDQHLDGKVQEDVKNFSRILYRRYPLHEMSSRNIHDVFGNAYSSWRFIQNLDRQRPKIRLFNPDYEKHGWVSDATVVAVLSHDMAFIRDSIRAEFHRRGIAIHQIYAALFSAERDENNRLVRVMEREAEGGNEHEEVLLYMEISRHSDPNILHDLEVTLNSIMEEVRLVNTDFQAMRDEVERTIDAISSTPEGLCSDSLKENIAFLKWSLENNFTFLGFERLAVTGKGKSLKIVREEGSALGLMKLRESRGAENLRSELEGSLKDSPVAKQQITFAKSVYSSRVHRDTYPQYFTVKCYSPKGVLTHQVRFLGLFTSPVYTQSTMVLPIVRNKVKDIIRRSGYKTHSHDAKEMTRILEVHPRDELFQSTIEQLFDVATQINQLQERRKVKLIVRRGSYNRFVSCLVFIPRDIYRTDLRINIQSILSQALGAEESEFTTYFSESILTRTHFFFKLAEDAPKLIDVDRLEQDVKDACYTWSEQLHDVLLDEYGEERGSRLSAQYSQAFQAGYREDFQPRTAINDIHRINELEEGAPIAMALYRVIGEEEDRLHFRLFKADSPLPLSDVIPVLENLGLRVIGENPYDIHRSDGRNFWIHDFSVVYKSSLAIELNDVAEPFKQAFARVWSGDADNDSFNRLVLATSIEWRDVAMLRAYARYMKQIRFNISDGFIADALMRYPGITERIVRMFYLRLDPDYSYEGRELAVEHAEQEVIDSLNDVSNLNDDTIFRMYVSLIKATLRSNFFKRDASGQILPTIVFKLAPRQLAQVPKPRPMFEIFVFSPRVEGVHLRGGKVARGGLRWSDRHEDFRTEILGLVKAQQVKNSVIVPVGAKGGFVCKQMPPNASRDVMLAEGIACYQLFIQSLLDVTDNLVDGVTVPPRAVVRWDEDDPYLVVAADKGTATFSDIANEISLRNQFWLGDAFASGGSQGFDHKKMGITARGAWVSVQRHFMQLGVDIQREDFSVVGIGDMAGDVFGNGMLLSEHICLCAAFNHMHIFVDPNPNSATSFKERQRLFSLPRSSWEDYDKSMISSGGGIFSRSAKSIAITPEMQRRFDIQDTKLTPTELIAALLKSPVDLVWNGGIGTYVKAQSESHADVGDKANDGLRINGSELRCKVVGEGGNLGFTQQGRIEYSLNGGLCNTDFIDNSAGVDCSDHEVNIKILLNDVVARGDMTEKQRNQLLTSLINPVAHLVLNNNFRQAQALTIAQSDAGSRIAEHQSIIHKLEELKLLDRRLENLPGDDEIAERRGHGQGLTRPEFAILMSYVKGVLKDELAKQHLADDPYVLRSVELAFPQELRETYRDNIRHHKLTNEIVATQMANDVVNFMGLTFVHRLHESTGTSFADILKAYTFAREVFGLKQSWLNIETADGQISASLQLEMLQNIVRLGRRSTRWALRNRRKEFDVGAEIESFTPQINYISENILILLQGRGLERWSKRFEDLVSAGCDQRLAHTVATSPIIYSSLGIIDAALQTGDNLLSVAKVFFAVGEMLELDWFADQMLQLKVETQWQALARETFMDDLDWQHRALTVNLLHCMRDMQCEIEGCKDDWMEQNKAHIDRWRQVIGQLKNADSVDFAMYSVATRELFDLAQSSVYR